MKSIENCLYAFNPQLYDLGKIIKNISCKIVYEFCGIKMYVWASNLLSSSIFMNLCNLFTGAVAAWLGRNVTRFSTACGSLCSTKKINSWHPSCPYACEENNLQAGYLRVPSSVFILLCVDVCGKQRTFNFLFLSMFGRKSSEGEKDFLYVVTSCIQYLQWSFKPLS